MRVYVGGKLGDTPVLVARSLEQAMEETLDSYARLPDTEAREEEWTCAFLDGEPSQLRCTLTATDQQGTVHALYVERYDIEDGEA